MPSFWDAEQTKNFYIRANLVTFSEKELEARMAQRENMERWTHER